MSDSLKKGALFPERLVNGLMSTVVGKSSMTKLANQIPISFNGNEMFVFSMDNEIDIVAENGKKSHGGISLEPIRVQPLKVEYGARITDEFMYAAEEEQINILKPFQEGFAKKLAKGIDLMAIHGVNPRTGEASTIIGDNCLDKKVTQTVTFSPDDPEANIEAAIAMIQGEEKEVSGMIMSPRFSSAMANFKVNGVKQYPEFKFGQAPESLGSMRLDINSTVSALQSKDLAIVGDFSSMFKWGYAKQIPMEVIEYGDPDNSGKDLKGYNQIYIRCEAYLGWAILDDKSFALIKEGA